MGFHGRGWWPRLAMSALMFLLAAAIASPQSTLPPSLLDEFADKLAAAIAPGTSVSLACVFDENATQAELARRLSARGLRVEDRDGATPVRCSCLNNLRERACLADIGEGGAHRVVAAARRRSAAIAGTHDPIVSLELRPIYTQRDPILDLAAAGSDWLVLKPTVVRLVPSQVDDRTGAAASQSIVTARIWPRDLRGRLRTTAGGFEAFLPGVACRGSVTPFTLVCGDESETWPIGIENGGIAPTRNAFATPEGLSFFEAARLGADGWLVVDEQRVLTRLDARRHAIGTAGVADHVVALRSPCSADVFVAASVPPADAESLESLRLLRLADGAPIAQSSTATLPGRLSALWPGTDDRSATAVVHDFRSGRYEAFQLSLSCAR